MDLNGDTPSKLRVGSLFVQVLRHLTVSGVSTSCTPYPGRGAPWRFRPPCPRSPNESGCDWREH